MYFATITPTLFVLLVYGELNCVVHIIIVLATRMRRRSLGCKLCSRLFQSEIASS